MTFESLIERWSAGGFAAVKAELTHPLLIALEPWLRPPESRRALRTIGVAGSPLFEASPGSPNDTTSEASAPVLRLVHSKLGERYPAHRLEIPLVRKTERNVYTHVAVGRSVNNDISLDQPSVSRFHADLRLIDGAFHVRDAKSRNGTRLNGAPVTSNRGERVRSGDVILFGEAACVFCEPTEEALLAVLGPR